MTSLNVSNEVFDELLSAIETCKRWGFYELKNQYSFVEKALINWGSVHHVDKNVLDSLVSNIKDMFNPNYCIVYESKKLIEINDKDEVNKYYKKNHYKIIQLTLPDRIEKVKLYLISKRN